MPVYFYKGYDIFGKEVKGKLKASNKKSAESILKSKGIYELTELGTLTSCSLRSLILFTECLAKLLEAGFSVLSAIENCKFQCEKMKGIAEDIAELIKQGHDLSSAVLKYERCFGKIYAELVKAGEESGELKESLSVLKNFLERKERFKEKLQETLFYPTILLVVSILVMLFVSKVVIPQFEDFYLNAGVSIPFFSQIVFSSAERVSVILALLLIFSVVLMVVIGHLKGKFEIVDGFLMKIPPLKFQSLSLFAWSMGILLKSGADVMHSLETSAKTSGNKKLEREIAGLESLVRSGASLSKAMRSREEVFKEIVPFVEVGENTGNLGEMFEKSGEFLAENLEKYLNSILKIVQPVAIIFIGLFIGIIVVAVYLPIFNLGEALM